MPVRFHRSIKLLPGMRLNLSKSGLGASFGPRGLKYSVGPRGTRKTASIIGTGLSFIDQSGNSRKEHQQSQPTAARSYSPPPKVPKKPMSTLKKVILWVVGILFGIPILLGVFSTLAGDPIANPTPTATQEILFFVDPTTPTIIATQMMTPTLAGAGEITLSPTQTVNSSSGCNCSKDYNCSDFTTHQQAQACFVSCGGSAANNWANLDGTDHDGLVCETLP